MSRVYNFSAGPAVLPEEVLNRAAAELSDYKGSGMSVMEMSHRSKLYLELWTEVKDRLRRVMAIPDTHEILFLQGGATLQFSGVPMNLLKGGTADYAVTGLFSKKAYQEGLKYGAVKAAADGAASAYGTIPPPNSLKLDKSAAYFHYCHNNTVFGTRWYYVPETGGVPLVCDMSSSILSEPVDVSKYGVIYAGAQKNMGPAGLTVVIVRKDLAGSAIPETPLIMDYAAQIKNDSMINTPATYGVYILGLVLEWVEKLGGLTAMEKLAKEKSDLLYDLIDDSGLYRTAVDSRSRSLMNVTFNLGATELDDHFVKQAAAKGLVTLKGHRATGGIRASIYNAMPIDGVKALVNFMKEFEFNNN
ncbi:3-phosphoserine/phosphohydroxythreonine aminotransferase [Clostridia bacterium]|nr:3-phosphoserine/phosphohydroxythreonine aminotransferase [Clostridia bacterium]GHV34033.1 3-phosphoserine/phosphohydroxythreonine aminotransferase [Clostridia bacterium]